MIIGNNAAAVLAYNQARRIMLRLKREHVTWAEVEAVQVVMMRINAQVDILDVKAILLAKGYNPYRLRCIA